MFLVSEFAGAQSPPLQHQWVFFHDKRTSALHSARPEQFGISKRAIQRRLKTLPPDRVIDELDLPVPEASIAQIAQTGIKIRTISRWFNAVSVEGTWQQILACKALPVVAATEPVALLHRSPLLPASKEPLQSLGKMSRAADLNYGPSGIQLSNMKVADLHAIGVNGAGILIGMLDDGFNNYRTHTALRNIKVDSTYDFIHNISDVDRQPWETAGQGDHGAGTLSAIGGFENGQLIGAAYGASFLLAKTEMDSSGNSFDFNSEEDTYVAALEWAERLGADITSSSLGYKEFWSSPTYTTSDMNGKTTKVARAALIASRKGVLVVTAMGNEGDMPMGLHRDSTLVSPADADSIISVGATSSDGELATFSSCGPTADGRIKPEVVAQGMAVYWANGSTTTGYSYVQGTSCSTPLVAGAAAVILSAHPELTNMQIRNALLSTARQYHDGTVQTATYPNNYYGYGFVDALSAAISCGPVFSQQPLILKTNHGYTITTFLVSKYVLYPDSIFYFYRYDDTSSYARALLVASANPNEYSTEVPLSSNDSLPRGYFLAREETGKLHYIPERYLLFQNYPNPFNHGTILRFDSPGTSDAQIDIVNLLGQRVKTIFRGRTLLGINLVPFDGTDERGHILASGVYFARLKSSDAVLSIKMLHIK
jgi:serine protease AprX